jgi:hypothetical protein
LGVKDGVVHLPKVGRTLLEGALAGDCGGHRPWVNIGQGVVLEDETNFWVAWQEFPENRIELAA